MAAQAVMKEGATKNQRYKVLVHMDRRQAPKAHARPSRRYDVSEQQQEVRRFGRTSPACCQKAVGGSAFVGLSASTPWLCPGYCCSGGRVPLLPSLLAAFTIALDRAPDTSVQPCHE
jgi:hypothetical protein